MEELTGIIYTSTECIEFTEEQLVDLERKASEANQAIGVSGYLCYNKGGFLQYIEGREEVVQGLMDKITDDPRHTVLYTMKSEVFYERLFPSWHMRYLTNPMLDKVGIEESMIRYMKFLSSNASSKMKDKKRIGIWSMVKTLSRLRVQLSAYS